MEFGKRVLTMNLIKVASLCAQALALKSQADWTVVDENVLQTDMQYSTYSILRKYDSTKKRAVSLVSSVYYVQGPVVQT